MPAYLLQMGDYMGWVNETGEVYLPVGEDLGVVILEDGTTRIPS
jgi:hypothetical protein